MAIVFGLKYNIPMEAVCLGFIDEDTELPSESQGSKTLKLNEAD